MRICPKKATAALNLLAIAAVVWLYCLDKIAADPVATMPARPSPLQAPDSVVPNRPVDRLEAGINMTNISLPAPPPASAAMPSPQAAVSQSPTSKQTFAEPTTPAPTPDPTPDPTLGAELTLVPLVPQPAQDTTAPIMPMIAKPIHVRPAKLNHVAVPPLTVSPVQPTPTALAPLAVPAPAKPMTAPALRPMTVPPPQQPPLSQTRAPQVTPLQDLHIRQANLLKGQQTLDMVAKEGGLDMEIFWPDTARQSAYLYDVMTRCFGMRSAVLNRAGEMVSTAGKGQANHAGLSPLIRQLKQPASRGEADVIAKIVAQHHVRGAYTPVRIFTKSVDARLVDGIAQLTKKPIGPNSVLRADYVIDRGRVFVANITHDGVRAAGRVLLVDGGC